MGKKTEQPAEPLSRPEFIARARKLRRINMRGWMLLFTLAAFVAIIPVASLSEPASMFGVLLFFAPMIFMLRTAFSGKHFRCPYCKAVFTEETAPLVVATGKCTTCSSVILTPAPAELQPGDKIFGREAFTHYHRFDRNQCKLWFISLVLIIIYIALWVFNTYTLVFLRLYPEIRFFVRVFYYYYYFFVIFTFEIFAIAYFLNRMRWRQPRGFNKCPHCHDLLDGVLPEVAIGSGRCGLCGNVILDHTTPSAVGGIYLKYRINTLPPEFYWITHAVVAAAILLTGIAYLDDDRTVYVLVLMIFGELLLIAWKLDFFHRFRRRCNHRRSSLITKYTGHCGVCGEDLTPDPALFKPTDGKIVVYFKDEGTNWEAFFIVTVLISFAFLTPLFIGKNSPETLDDWATAILQALIGLTIFSIPLLIFVFLARNKEYAMLISDDKLEGVGKTTHLIDSRDITGCDFSENYNPQSATFRRSLTLKTGGKAKTISFDQFIDHENINQIFDTWLNIVRDSAPETIPDVVTLEFDPEITCGTGNKPYKPLAISLTVFLPFLVGILGWIAYERDLQLLIVACIMLLAVWLFSLLYLTGHTDEKYLLYKYTGIRLSPDGVTLLGKKEKLYPMKKIRKVAVNSYSVNGQKRYVMNLYTVATFSGLTVHLEWFADPERARRMLSAWDARR